MVEIYNATVAEQKKYRPDDPTSAHWYTVADFERLVHSYIGHARKGGEDLPLGKFVRQFKGLSATAKAKAVCSHFSEIERLSDFEDRENQKHEIKFLLDRMKRHSKPPTAKTLGFLGGENIRRRFEEIYGGLEDFDYQRAELELLA